MSKNLKSLVNLAKLNYLEENQQSQEPSTSFLPESGWMSNIYKPNISSRPTPPKPDSTLYTTLPSHSLTSPIPILVFYNNYHYVLPYFQSFSYLRIKPFSKLICVSVLWHSDLVVLGYTHHHPPSTTTGVPRVLGQFRGFSQAS